MKQGWRHLALQHHTLLFVYDICMDKVGHAELVGASSIGVKHNFAILKKWCADFAPGPGEFGLVAGGCSRNNRL